MMTVQELIGDFASVSLAELVSEAELLKRVDRKYLVPASSAASVIRFLDPRTRVLEIDGKREFTYDSVYFDTPDHRAYHLSAVRRRHRFKVRTRTYVDTGDCYLEVKTKDGRGATVKTRIAYPRSSCIGLTNDGREFVRATLSESGCAAELADHVTASMVNSYRRTTLLLPCGSRATIDTDVRWRDFDGRDARMAGDVIIESKSVGLASDLDHALWGAGHRPVSISKFGVGTAVLNPRLPHNKWARAMDRAFSKPCDLAEFVGGAASSLAS